MHTTTSNEHGSLRKVCNFQLAYRADIDGLRAIAVSLVVVYHAFPAKFRGGFAGVDIFFVISGYLISSIILNSLSRQNFSIAEFYVRRIRRIFPALIGVLAFAYAFGWMFLLPEDFEQLGKHIAAGVFFVLNYVMYQEAGYFDTVSELKPLLHLWSLAIEEQFYILYPMLLWSAWRARFSITLTIALLCIVSFVFNVASVRSDAVGTFFLPHTRYWELLIGGLIASLPQTASGYPSISPIVPAIIRPELESRLRDLFAVVGLVLCVATVFVLSRSKAFPGWWALLPVAGSALIIVAGSGAWANRNILANRFLVLVGLFSYPLYLWHWPLLSFARIAGPEMLFQEMRIGAVLLSIVLAYLTWKFVEIPIRSGSKSLVKPAVLSVLCLSLGGAGFHAYRNNGLPFRLLDSSIASAQFPWRKLQNENCLSRFPQFSPMDYCLLSRDAEPELALIGDSHANQLYPGLAEQFVTIDLGNGGCVPFLDVERQDRPDRSAMCPATQTRQALEFALSNPSVKYVVMTARFNTYLSGIGFGENERSQQSDPIRLISGAATGNVEIFAAGMRRTLQMLTASDKKVIFALDTPEIGFSPKTCIGLRFGPISPRTPCAVSRVEFEGRDLEYRALLRKITEEYPSLKVVDPAGVFCDGSYCWAKKGSEFLYRDDDHLSVEGSRLIAGIVARTLLQDAAP